MSVMSPTVPQWLLSIPIAHRGLHDAGQEIPENSMAAFRAAASAGYPFELDVRLSRDGEAVVFHDATLERMTGEQGRVSEIDSGELVKMSLAGTDEKIPLLKALLDESIPQARVLVEIKNETPAAGELEAEVWRLLSESHTEWAVQSFNPATLVWFKENAPAAVRGHLAGDFRDSGLDEFTRERLRAMESLPSTAPHFIGYDVRCLPHEPVERAGLAGIPIVGWTVRSSHDEARARLYCDNIIFEGYTP